MKPYVVVLSGPTASGKTDIVLRLGEFLPIEIINADIGSFYTPLSVGTAKPNWQSSSIMHHLFDIIDQPQAYTVFAFRNALQELLDAIWQRGRIPVLVGGSGFYIQSFFYEQHAITTDPEYIAQLERLPSDDLYKQLQDIDMQRAHAIALGDRYRIIRALALYQATGKKPSLFAPQYKPLAPFYYTAITWDRSILYKRINERTQNMMHTGWVQEVEELQGTVWEDFLRAGKVLGYDDVLHYLDGAVTQDAMQASIAQKTRHYAKRQITFLKKLTQDLRVRCKEGKKPCKVAWTDLTFYELGLYINQLAKDIEQFFI